MSDGKIVLGPWVKEVSYVDLPCYKRVSIEEHKIVAEISLSATNTIFYYVADPYTGITIASGSYKRKGEAGIEHNLDPFDTVNSYLFGYVDEILMNTGYTIEQTSDEVP